MRKFLATDRARTATDVRDQGGPPLRAHRRHPLAALAVVAGVAGVATFAGCSSDPEPKAQTTSDVTSTEGTEPGGGGASQPSDRTPTAGRTPDDGGTQVIASSAGRHRADPNDATMVPLRLDVYSVRRLAGDTLQVRFAIENTGTGATFRPYSELEDPKATGGRYDVGGVAVLDRPNNKKYLPLVDTAGVCLCSADLSDVAITPGATVAMYADVSAPPASTTTVGLTVPGFDPIDGLAVR